VGPVSEVVAFVMTMVTRRATVELQTHSDPKNPAPLVAFVWDQVWTISMAVVALSLLLLELRAKGCARLALCDRMQHEDHVMFCRKTNRAQ
jgi:hypothetical protein